MSIPTEHDLAVLTLERAAREESNNKRASKSRH
jgi:hypothetical protein